MAEAENPAQQFVDTEFPVRLRPLIPPALRRAYAAVDYLVEGTEWLNNPSGKCQRGQLVVKAVEHQIVQLIRAGSLPFDFAFENYASPTGKHLVMRTARSRLTINQMPNSGEKPRKALFRDNFGMANMRSLFAEWNAEADREATLRHLVLLHGYQALTFATIILPHPKKTAPLYETSNLFSGLSVVSADDRTTREGPTEAPDPEDLDELKRFLRDQDM